MRSTIGVNDDCLYVGTMVGTYDTPTHPYMYMHMTCTCICPQEPWEAQEEAHSNTGTGVGSNFRFVCELELSNPPPPKSPNVFRAFYRLFSPRDGRRVVRSCIMIASVRRTPVRAWGYGDSTVPDSDTRLLRADRADLRPGGTGVVGSPTLPARRLGGLVLALAPRLPAPGPAGGSPSRSRTRSLAVSRVAA